MQHTTISNPEYHYVKLYMIPHDEQTLPIDRATMHILLTRAMTETYGKVGAGAMSGLGNGIEVVDISQPVANAAHQAGCRQVLLKVASS